MVFPFSPSSSNINLKLNDMPYKVIGVIIVLIVAQLIICIFNYGANCKKRKKNNMNYFIIPGVDNLSNKSINKTERMREIFNIVCREFKHDPQIVLESNKNRKRVYVEIRQISWYLFMKKIDGLSLADAGWFFRKDHSTVLHAIKTVNNLLETSMDFRNKVKNLIKT